MTRDAKAEKREGQAATKGAFGRAVFWVAVSVCAVAVAGTALFWYPPFAQSTYQPQSTAPFFEKAGTRVNVNTAPAEELCLLPGIGEKRAEAIVEYRLEHGAFAAPEDLLVISGIGPKSLEALVDLIAF